MSPDRMTTDRMTNASLPAARLVFLLSLCAWLLASGAAFVSAATFTTIALVDSVPSDIPGLEISVLIPQQGEYIMSTDHLTMSFSLHYNFSATDVRCDILIDGVPAAPVHEDIASMNDNIISASIDLGNGQHTAGMRCEDNFGNSETSEQHTFTIDLVPPTISLDYPADNEIFSNATVLLNFTPSDTIAATLDCNLTIGSDSGIFFDDIPSGVTQGVLYTEYPSGAYDWNVTCEDRAGNSQTSPARTFFVSEEITDFSVRTNKQDYALGEGGYFIIDAPQGADLTMFVATADNLSYFLPIGAVTYPYLMNINFTDHPGTYYVDSLFRYHDDLTIVHNTFSVINTFSMEIDVNDTSVKRDEALFFESSVSGGIVPLTYLWDFDDGATSSEQNPSHQFSEIGTYGVSLHVTDSRGNALSDSVTVRVRQQYDIQFIVLDSSDSKVRGAMVTAEGTTKESGGDGVASFTLFNGENEVRVNANGFERYVTYFNISEARSYNLYLVRDDGSSSLSDGEQSSAQPSDGATQPDGTATSAPAGGSAAAGTFEAQAEILEAKIDVVLPKFEGAAQSMTGIDASSKEVAKLLKLANAADKATSTLRNYRRDIFNIRENKRSLSSDEQLAELRTIDSEIETMLSTTPRQIKTAGTERFVYYPTQKDVQTVTDALLSGPAAPALDDRAKQRSIKANAKLQELISVSVTAYAAQVTYLNEQTDTLLVVDGMVDSAKPTVGYDFMVAIPKEIAKSADDLLLLSAHKVANPDPVIIFDIAEDKHILFAIKNVKDAVASKDLSAALLENPASFSSQDSGTGFSVFGSGALQGLDLKRSIMYSVVATLVIILLFTVFDTGSWFGALFGKKRASAKHPAALTEASAAAAAAQATAQADDSSQPKAKPKERSLSFMGHAQDMMRSLFGDKNLATLRAHLEKAYDHIDNKQLDKAHDEYVAAMAIYNKLPDTPKRDKVLAASEEVYNELLMENIVQLGEQALVYKKMAAKKQAHESYLQMQELYKQLLPRFKKRVSKHCMNVFKKLQEK